MHSLSYVLPPPPKQTNFPILSLLPCQVIRCLITWFVWAFAHVISLLFCWLLQVSPARSQQLTSTKRTIKSSSKRPNLRWTRYQPLTRTRYQQLTSKQLGVYLRARDSVYRSRDGYQVDNASWYKQLSLLLEDQDYHLVCCFYEPNRGILPTQNTVRQLETSRSEIWTVQSKVTCFSTSVSSRASHSRVAVPSKTWASSQGPYHSRSLSEPAYYTSYLYVHVSTAKTRKINIVCNLLGVALARMFLGPFYGTPLHVTRCLIKLEGIESCHVWLAK